ncbi:GW domain-containing glycosaminoglycan-binding protein [Listeria valentina]|uniref:GW domain-containing glycosaminoglycan-binding protein n=1 Tax=Listeria valentina TaxID=2705293 RepID=UPI00143050C0|nr:GW domain-containing glycosaminoglycan-binding protein [Listeria valentina]
MKILLHSAFLATGLAIVAIPSIASADEVNTPQPHNTTDDLKSADEQSIYVPQAIREGKVTEENDGFEDGSDTNVLADVPMLRAAGYPDVNSYIKSKNFSTASIEYQLKSQFPKFNYRNGYGKPEGIVLHETANNNSTIQNEIDYMSKNWQNAFVHTFVDKSRIIQIHPTDNAVWGAGQYANARFIQFELVRSKTFDDFARSINNYAYYSAYLLTKYNMKIDSAEGDGKGTVWSHNAVTKYLGGTTHTDPIGYFNQYGYNWNSMIALIQEKYNQINNGVVQYDKVIWAYARVKTPNTVIYSKPTGATGATSVGNLSSYSGKQMRLVREAKVGNTISSQISVDGKVIGWVNNAALDIFYKTANETSLSGYRMVKTASQNEGYYMLPVAEPVDKKGTLKNLYNKVLTVDRQVTVDGVVWNRMKNGTAIVGWTKASNLGLTVSTNDVVWAYARVKTANTTIYSGPVDFATAVSVGNLSSYSGKQMRLVRQARVGNTISSQISVDGKVIGWVNNAALDIFYKTANETSLSGYRMVKTASQNEGYYMLPVAEPVDKKGTLKNLYNKVLTVDRQVTVDGVVWNRMKNGSTLAGWTKASNLGLTVSTNDIIWAYARVKTANTTIYSGPVDFATAVSVGNLSSYSGKQMRLVRQARVGNTISSQISVDGKVIGWVNNSALDIFYKSANEKAVSLKRMVKATSQSAGYYMLPVAETADKRGTLKDIYDKELTVDREVTVDGVVWQRMKDGSKLLGWTKASDLGAAPSYNKAIWSYARVKTANTAIYSAPVGSAVAASVGNLSTYSGKQIRLIREAEVGSTISSQISVEGKLLGWVNNSALNVFYKSSMEKIISVKRTVKNTNGVYYQLPVPEPVDRKGTLAAYAGKTLTVDREVTVDGAVWNRMKDGSVIVGWTLASNLKA